jgi:hypothetical protein
MSNYTSIYTGAEIDAGITASINLINFEGTPTALTINLTGGVAYTVKASPGWVCAFGAGTNNSTQIRNNTTLVWSGDYFQSPPFYLNNSIKLYSSVDNTVSIVYA